MSVFSFLSYIFRPFYWHLIIFSTVSLVCALDMVIKPYCVKWIIDSIVTDSSGDLFKAIHTPVLIFIGLSFAVFLGYRITDYVVMIRMIPRLRTRLTLCSIDEIMKRDYRYFQDHFAGTINQRAADLTASTPDLIEMFFYNILRVLLAILISSFVLWQSSPLFGLLILGWTLAFLGICTATSNIMARLSSTWAQIGMTVSGFVVDWITNIFSVIIFARHKHERKVVERACERAIKAEEKLQWTNFVIASILGILTIAMHIIAIVLLVSEYKAQRISIGDFALVLTLNTTLIHQVWLISEQINKSAKLWGRIKQAVQAIYQHNPKQQQLTSAQSFQNGNIQFDKITFAHKNRDLFQNFSLTIQQGERIGLVGYSGAGKSTLTYLILKLFQPQQGAIYLGNQSIEQISSEDLYSHIAYVPQEPGLFHRSLLENIRYGNPDATYEEVVDAAKKAYAHEFIISLPKQYNSEVGERGVKLSGGQRQRIAIARAILKNAPILIIDEATSQLDSVTEHHIQEALHAAMDQKTTIVVAHRLSTLRHMDRIVVLDEGRLIEEGSHAELIDKKGLYATLWHSQMNGMLPERRS